MAPELLARAQAGEDVSADVPYTLRDMAQDALTVLDDLGIERAHVVGASMGGMIAQELAIEFPDRVRSMTSIMSTTGDPEVGGAEPGVMEALLSPTPADRDAVIARAMAISRAVSGPLWDEGEALARASAAYDRSFHPIGALFQMTAIAASGNRTERLRSVDVPTLVVHGRVDPLIRMSGGVATAEAIPGSDLLILGHMGHSLPPLYWGQLADAIGSLARRSALPPAVLADAAAE